MWRMLKSTAIELLGGTTTAAAEAIGVSYQAIDKWPAVLPRRIEDRVLAAQARKYLPAELLGAARHTTAGPLGKVREAGANRQTHAGGDAGA